MDRPACTPPHDDWDSLLAAARASSQSALGEVFNRLKRVLHRLAEVQIDPELHVKVSESDLLQETFLEAYRDFCKFSGRTLEELLAWLSQMLIRNAEDQRKRHRRASRHGIGRNVSLEELPSETVPHLKITSESAESQVTRAEDMQPLLRALGSLPIHYRQVFQLHDVDGQSDEEIARRLRCTANAVRCVRRRARSLLRDNLQECLAETPTGR